MKVNQNVSQNQLAKKDNNFPKDFNEKTQKTSGIIYIDSSSSCESSVSFEDSFTQGKSSQSKRKPFLSNFSNLPKNTQRVFPANDKAQSDDSKFPSYSQQSFSFSEDTFESDESSQFGLYKQNAKIKVNKNRMNQKKKLKPRLHRQTSNKSTMTSNDSNSSGLVESLSSIEDIPFAAIPNILRRITNKITTRQTIRLLLDDESDMSSHESSINCEPSNQISSNQQSETYFSTSEDERESNILTEKKRNLIEDDISNSDTCSYSWSQDEDVAKEIFFVETIDTNSSQNLSDNFRNMSLVNQAESNAIPPNMYPQANAYEARVDQFNNPQSILLNSANSPQNLSDSLRNIILVNQAENITIPLNVYPQKNAVDAKVDQFNNPQSILLNSANSPQNLSDSLRNMSLVNQAVSNTIPPNMYPQANAVDQYTNYAPYPPLPYANPTPIAPPTSTALPHPVNPNPILPKSFMFIPSQVRIPPKSRPQNQ